MGPNLNLQSVFTYTELHLDHPNNHVLVFLDLEKAFYSVDCVYMGGVLVPMKFEAALKDFTV